MTDQGLGRTHIWTEVEFGRSGKQIGFLHVPHSVSRSAYGNINIPIALVARGEGPTVLLMAGNHGDEYEGQITLVRLVRDLEASDVCGRVIIMPAANLPAALASSRVSPVDGGNLNRAFPGDPDGSPTSQIAYYIDGVLLPMSDAWIDLHSGGGSLDYLPFAALYESDADHELDSRADALLRAFGAPRSVRVTAKPDRRLAAATAHRRRVPYIGGEWGGGGSVDIDGVDFTRFGVLRAMKHLGIVPDLERFGVPVAGVTALMEWAGRDHYVFSEHAGLFEPKVRLGCDVVREQLCGHIHFVDDPGRDSVPVHFRRDGMVICLRHLARVEPGDCLSHTVIRK
jgi:predicted deacylase